NLYSVPNSTTKRVVEVHSLADEIRILAQLPIADKSNEIPAVRPLLTNLALAGRLITADAIHAQKNY
ncbi:MAG: hypothetical protein HQL76_18050, partial [Magnetococcales bacterium]|nr:hypothetical protein [Magnetococcales bacterium]